MVKICGSLFASTCEHDNVHVSTGTKANTAQYYNFYYLHNHLHCMFGEVCVCVGGVRCACVW